MNKNTAQKKLNELSKRDDFSKILSHIEYMREQNYYFSSKDVLNTMARYNQVNNFKKFYELFFTID